MHSEQTHLAGAGREPRACATCGTVFTPKRSWSRFCSTKCRNNFHGEERRKEQQRAAAPDLYDALLSAHHVLRGTDLAHVWLNHPTTPEVTLAKKIEAALTKAGYKEPKPEKPKPVAQAAPA